MQVVALICSRLALDLVAAMAAWKPVEPDTSLHIADAARRLAALARREFSADGEHLPPLRWDLHAEVDALVLTLDDLDKAMRVAAAEGDDAATIRRAVVAAQATGLCLVRLGELIETRGGYAVTQPRLRAGS
jgi:hypothetical protein